MSKVVNYEGQVYLLFEDSAGFRDEVTRSKKALLRTSFNALDSDISNLFAHMSQQFGETSVETRAVMEAKLFCGSCGVAYSKNAIPLLIMRHQIGKSNIPNRCPKCNSTELLYVYHA